MKPSPQVTAYFRKLGSAATGDKKRRGDAEHYARIGRIGRESRAAQKAQALRQTDSATVERKV